MGVTTVYGLDDPKSLKISGLKFPKEHELTPGYLIDELQGAEKWIFRTLYAGSITRTMYRLYEFQSR